MHYTCSFISTDIVFRDIYTLVYLPGMENPSILASAPDFIWLSTRSLWRSFPDFIVKVAVLSAVLYNFFNGRLQFLNPFFLIYIIESADFLNYHISLESVNTQSCFSRGNIESFSTYTRTSEIAYSKIAYLLKLHARYLWNCINGSPKFHEMKYSQQTNFQCYLSRIALHFSALGNFMYVKKEIRDAK